ncbi:alpha/beta fold hydrolase [Duganella sp. FT94W]|uniref:Alpha/beta fold hydrolase n=2 Tax=Duganella lactea TaxID=2692173 RepID=A0ABW9VAJ4_9BURK|nr:alpha/beta fold hydrolase [Duganella lactea]
MAAAPQAPDTARYRYTTIEGRPLAYLDQGEGFPVLLGHSYLWNARMWQPQIDALSRHFRVIAPDLWGHGRSAALPEGTRDMQDLARHNLALLDALSINECHLVGLSVGGMWGSALKQMAPERVRKLVLMDTYLGPEPAQSQAQYLGMLRRLEVDQALSEALLNMVVPMFFSPHIDPAAPLCQGFRATLEQLSTGQIVDSIVPLGRLIFTRSDRRDLLPTLDPARTLVMVGEYDLPRPPREASEMARLIGCPLQTIANAGHISNLENRHAVNQALLEFLLHGR